MSSLAELLAGGPDLVVTAGADVLAEPLLAQGVPTVAVPWRPPLAGTADALDVLDAEDATDAANAVALDRMLSAAPMLVDLRPAADVVGLGPRQLLHAGPPLTWEAASGPMRGGIIAACLYEGWAATPEEAEGLAASGGLELSPCHHHGAVGPMAGIVSPSMPMWVLEDAATGGRAACTLNEGLGKVLRYGAYEPSVIDRLRWMERVLGPVLAAGLRAHGPLDVRAMIATAVAMGDEGHNRNRAGTSLLVRTLAPHLVRSSGAPPADVADVLAFMHSNDHFFLNLVMPAGKLAADAARDVAASSLVVVMARNGTEFGIQLSGTGDAWFTAPANVPRGLYLGTYGDDDANPDIGDSAITETVGLGGFAMAASPTIVELVGGEVADAVRFTTEMYDITLAEHPSYRIPTLGPRGTPVGIDARLVARTGTLPMINTGIAGRVAGTGQVGAGLVRPPERCFVDALASLAAAARRAA